MYFFGNISSYPTEAVGSTGDISKWQIRILGLSRMMDDDALYISSVNG